MCWLTEKYPKIRFSSTHVEEGKKTGEGLEVTVNVESPFMASEADQSASQAQHERRRVACGGSLIAAN